MIRRESDRVYRITCDAPTCTRTLHVIAEWAMGAKTEARRAGWRITVRLRGSAAEAVQYCPGCSEKPSQSTTLGGESGRMIAGQGPSNRTTPGERANAQTEGLTTDYVGVEVAYDHDTRTEAN